MCDSRIIISKDQHRLYFNIADRELLSLPQFCHRFRLNIIKAAQRMLGGMTLVQALFSTGNCLEPDTGGDGKHPRFQIVTVWRSCAGGLPGYPIRRSKAGSAAAGIFRMPSVFPVNLFQISGSDGKTTR